jgi:hypothetical protein
MTFDTTFDSDGQDLDDAREVAARVWFKNARTVHDQRVHRQGIPAPVARQGRALLWSWAQGEMWDAAGHASAGPAGSSTR